MDNEISFVDEDAVGELIPKLKEFNETRNKIKELEAEVSDLKTKRDQLIDQCLDMMANGNVHSMVVDGVNIYPIEKTVASYKKESEGEAFTFLQNSGYGGIVKLSVNSKSLSSAVKEMLDEGIEIPDVIKVTKLKSLGVRKK